MSKPFALALTVPATSGRTRRIATELALALTAATVMAISAQIRIPWQPVPFTMQTFALMLFALALGPRVGLIGQIMYLGAGIAGAPVFSNMTSGTETLLGPTGGYLASFLFVTIWLGFVAEKGWDEKPLNLAAALLAGIAINLGLGWVVLSGFIGSSKAWATGVSPFLMIEVAKAFVVTLLLPTAIRSIRKARTLSQL